ncbi:hypothetical protein ACG7TL_003250 [Trametes sanguinea]
MQMVETQTVTLLDCNLPRTKSSSSDDSFTALMNAVLDSTTRASGGSLESTATSTSTSTGTASTSSTDGTADTTNTADTADSSKTSASGDGGASARTSTTSDASAGIEMKGPALAATGSTASTSTSSSTTSSLTSLSVPATPASAGPSPSPSAASSTAPSPCPSILRSSSSSLTLPSRTGSPSITFAPLPTTEPRKRSGVHPLGVAARSRLLRHRRMLREQGLHPDDVPYPYPYSEQDQGQDGQYAQYQYRYGPGSGVQGGLGVMDDPPDTGRWGEEIREAEAGVDADEDARARAVGGRGRGPRGRTVSDPGEGDPLVSLGRLVKGAGKSLWRSISMKEVRSKETRLAEPTAEPGPVPDAQCSAHPPPASDEQTQAQENGPPPPRAAPKERSATLPRKTEVHLFDDPGTRTPSAEGGVWEEDVDEESLKKLLAGPQAAPATAEKTPQPQRAQRTSIEPVANVKRPKRSSTMEVFAARIR